MSGNTQNLCCILFLFPASASSGSQHIDADNLLKKLSSCFLESKSALSRPLLQIELVLETCLPVATNLHQALARVYGLYVVWRRLFLLSKKGHEQTSLNHVHTINRHPVRILSYETTTRLKAFPSPSLALSLTVCSLFSVLMAWSTMALPTKVRKLRT